MPRVARQDRATPYTDKWREHLRAIIDQERGLVSDLARFLADGDPSRVESKRVQIHRILNTRTVPDAEFLLQVEAWLAERKRDKR